MKTMSVIKSATALLLVTSVLTLAACTKARDPQFPSGAGENLQAVSDYNGKTFEIQTAAPIADKILASSKAESREAKALSIGAGDFAVVNYEVSNEMGKKLLGNTPIVGKPNTTYIGLIRVDQNHIKVLKVGEVEQIPAEERTYAEKLEDGRLAVPIIGYPLVGRYTIERARNDRGENTTSLYERSRENIAEATHVRIDFSRPEVFHAVVKTDIFPVKYFEGEWFYSETITSAPEEQATVLGFNLQEDQTLMPSTRVKFITDQNKMSIVNLNLDERLVNEDNVNFKTAATIYLDWKAYRISDNGRALREEEDNEIHWSRRPYVQLNLGGISTPKNKGMLGKLVALEINDDYFSFTTESDENIRFKYSLKRVTKSNYTAKRLFEEDKKQFGYFETVKSRVMNFEIRRKEDIEKQVFISRFNPKNGKIVYHFTKTTPQWIRPHVRKAVEAWDETFEKAGTGIRVVLDEKMDVELGDIRYNAINIIENLTASNLFGYGPSITDPKTGEIISATSNVHITPIREAIIEEIKNYIYMKIGLLEEGKIAGISTQLAEIKAMTTSTSADGAALVHSPMVTRELKLALKLPKEGSPNELEQRSLHFVPAKGHRAHEFDVGLSSSNLHEEIENACPDVVSYVNTIKANGTTHNDDEVRVLSDCSKKMVVMKFLGTLIHEMGHNFGLRHNFMASNDVANFWPKEVTQTKHPVRSSSTMEYPAFNEDRLIKPGMYDVAALRFGYADKVEAKDGQIVALDPSKTIKANLAAKQLEKRPFKFCTDEDVELSIDPMCNRHDAGVTPLEIVRNKIADYQASYQLLNYRRDGIGLPDPGRLAKYRIQAHFIPLLRFYQQWRLGLAKFVGQQEQYLERMSVADYEAVVKRMKADPNYEMYTSPTGYGAAAREAFRFFLGLANMSNRYCITGTQDNGLKLVELMRTREQMFLANGAKVKTCADATPLLNSVNLTLLGEVGHELTTFRFDMSPEASTEPMDVIGSQVDRMVAMKLISIRDPLSLELAMRNFTPAMMDEPALREGVKKIAFDRLLKGVDGRNVLAEDTKLAIAPEVVASVRKQHFPNFAAEKELVLTLFNTFIESSVVPGKSDITMSRLGSMKGMLVPTLENELAQKAVVLTQLPNGSFFVVTEARATDAIAIVKAFQSLMELRSVKAFDLSVAENKALADKLKELLPSNAELATLLPAQASAIWEQLKPTLAAAARKDADSTLFLTKLLFLSDKLHKSIVEGEKAEPEAAKRLAATPIVEHFKAQGVEFNLTKENVDKLVADQNSKAKFYSENRSEIDAQFDMLINVITAIGNL